MKHLVLASLLTILNTSGPLFSQEKIWFEHHFVSTDLPTASWVRFGTPALADFDQDGDVDFALSITRGTVYWFEYEGDFRWTKHSISEIPTGQLGGGAIDVDEDGWPDLVAGGYWFRNSGQPSEKPFERIQYDTSINREIHDLVFSDINNDGKQDLVVLGDREGCFWYEIPSDPVKNITWIRHEITEEVLDSKTDIHGGFFPGGVGDLDLDGDVDIVLPGRWYRNEGQGLSWSKQFLPFGSAGYWGLSGRSWIIDLDKDGDQDIIMVGGDQVDSRGAWLENNGKETPGFQVHLLPMKAEGRRGSFHSLWVADFDLDGDPDIFTIEQEDASILPTGATMRAFVWENMDGKGQHFEERIVLDQNTGGHDVQFADVDGDGDLDAYYKIWATLSTNGLGGKSHVNFLENKAR
ncbi:MAG: VCBS repeat-containing protein [Saprospiraceae bacterium]|nr:VCBS repeat-containing protein [Saprospiraceae bacterium]